jgi:hypothetical protein
VPPHASTSFTASSHLWEVATGRSLARWRHAGGAQAVAFAANGSALAAGGHEGVVVWMNGLWQALLSADPREAHDATWKLAACADSASFLAKRLRPIGPLDAERLKKLLMDLDADDFVVRERATQQLAGLGQTAAPALRKEAGTDAGPETLARVRLLLKRLESTAAVAESRRSVRAVAALEANNSAESRGLLNALAGGAPEAGLTKAAGAARARLEEAKHR